jgi:hypothetical protein
VAASRRPAFYWIWGGSRAIDALDKERLLCYGACMEIEKKRTYLVRDIVAGFIIGIILAAVATFMRMP